MSADKVSKRKRRWARQLAKATERGQAGNEQPRGEKERQRIREAS